MAGSSAKSAATYLSEMARVLDLLDCDALDAYADIIYESWRTRRSVFIFGNGGSASTASHHVLDLVKTAAVDGQPRLKAFSMNDNFGITTAIGNDVSYQDTFAFPLSAYAEAGDVAVAITCSGNSGNILAACHWARQRGLKIVALTGFAGGKVQDLADLHINVPSDNYGVIEDLHLSVGHIVAQMLKARIEATTNDPAAAVVPTKA